MKQNVIDKTGRKESHKKLSQANGNGKLYILPCFFQFLVCSYDVSYHNFLESFYCRDINHWDEQFLLLIIFLRVSSPKEAISIVLSIFLLFHFFEQLS